MKHTIKKYLTDNLRVGITIFLGLLLVNSCKTCTSNDELPLQKGNEQGTKVTLLKTNEIVLFCGNPGVGKSALLNSIFQQLVFRSGLHATGLTKVNQDYFFENTLYVDTPGLSVSDAQRLKKAAKEIERSLKKNGNYKIIFVVTLETARIRTMDIVTINKICEAIHTPFEYGLIINKVTDKAIKIVNSNMSVYVSFLTKKPSSTLIIKRDNEIDDANNIFITDPAVRKELVNFINNLKASKIAPKDVRPIGITDYKQQAEQLQQDLDKVLREKH